MSLSSVEMVVLDGDLRHLLPVIKGGTRTRVVNIAVTNSPLWNSIVGPHLRINMCLSIQPSNPILQDEVATFVDWILSVAAPKLELRSNMIGNNAPTGGTPELGKTR